MALPGEAGAWSNISSSEPGPPRYIFERQDHCSGGHITLMPSLPPPRSILKKSRQDLSLAGLTSSDGPDWTFATEKRYVILWIWGRRLDRSNIPQRCKFWFFRFLKICWYGGKRKVEPTWCNLLLDFHPIRILQQFKKFNTFIQISKTTALKSNQVAKIKLSKMWKGLYKKKSFHHQNQ